VYDDEGQRSLPAQTLVRLYVQVNVAMLHLLDRRRWNMALFI